MKWLALPLLAVTLAACSTAPKKSPPPAVAGKPHLPARTAGPVQAATAGCVNRYAPAQEDLSKRGDYKAGGLYAPHVPDTTPDHVPDVDCIPEPVVTQEAPSRVGNRSPYSVLGKQYEIMRRVDGYVEQGTASYYGNKFHGRRTSNQEVYDMYAFTAAHKTLPLPSFARVTNLDTGKSVVVRVNDRGPFHEGRVIDLSYAAAVKLGITQRGTGRVEVRALTGDEREGMAAAPAATPVLTTVATGVPTRIATGKPTAMDELVGKLPTVATAMPKVATPAANIAAAPVPASAAVATVASSEPWRYHVTPDLDRKPTADEFDAWMKSRGVRVATGKPVAAEKTPESARPTQARVESVGPDASFSTGVPPRQSATAPRAASDDVQLQVASFASRENADRALARLSAAGIGRASLSDVASNGRTLWRLRVEAADAAAASELANRIAGLGFGQPQVVRE
ncbi:MAG: septal ring lytic transglycosylase RlpA family protein [Pseudoxanthomonas sp.]